ncbi:MAG: CinA family nicotinamide mononucleotide deamidase-related protein [Anaerolineae bacterium]
MNAEIVTSGTELLLGEITDTNSTYIARALRDAGINLYYKTSVGDNVERMALVLRQGMERSDLIITTGGLGPTVDDVTREAVALATGRELVLYPECLAAIEAIFARWGRQLSENNRRQAYLPAGAIPIMNPVGTAPGFIVETEKSTIIALPGVPREMEHLMQTAVIPYLKQRLGAEQAIIKARNLRTVGLGESWIDERIDAQMRSANPTVGLAAHYGIVDIRITARAATEAEADVMIAQMEAQIRRAIGDEGIFGVDDDTLEGVTGRLLGRAGVKLAIVESATGGEVARLLRSTAEGAAAITAAHVVESPEALAALLDMSSAKLAEFGWISEMAAAEAAALLSDTYEGGWGLAVLGDMDAPSDVYGEETGQTFVALATPTATVVRRYPYGGTGFLARQWVTLRAIDLVRRQALVQLNQEKST